MKVINFESREILINDATNLIKQELVKHDNKPHAIMLSGGSTPLAIYQKIASTPFQVDSNAVITYSDERFVPPDHKDNNYFNTKPMLDALRIGQNNIIRVKTELGFNESVEAFNENLFQFLKIGRLPLGLLGMGTDGHTASLFSLKNVIEGKDKMAIGVLKDTPPNRISVTKDFLLKCNKLVLLLTGQEKQEVLNTLLTAPDTIPAGVVLKDHSNVEIWVSK